MIGDFPTTKAVWLGSIAARRDAVVFGPADAHAVVAAVVRIVARYRWYFART